MLPTGLLVAGGFGLGVGDGDREGAAIGSLVATFLVVVLFDCRVSG